MSLLSNLQAQTYTWNTGTTSGNWSATGDWTPTPGTGGPGSGTTADLNNVSANTIVTYDSGASGLLGTLNITQTSAFINELMLNNNLNVTNAITLGASGGGTSELYIDPTTTPTANYDSTLTTSGITVASGGILELGAITTASFSGVSEVVGNVTMTTGGAVNVERFSGGGSSAADIITGTFAMSGGTLNLGSAATGATGADNRLAIDGNFTATGGTIVDAADGSLYLYGHTNVITGMAYNTAIGITLFISSNTNSIESLETDTILGAVGFRADTDSGDTTIFEVREDSDTFNNETPATVGKITFQESGAGGTEELELVTNLAETAGAAMPGVNGTASGATTFIIDTTTNANSYTLDLSQASGGFTPAANGTAGTATWSFQGNGTIKAPYFSFNSTNLAETVGSSGNAVTLQATGGNATPNSFGTTTTFDPSSTFLYSGSAAAATPATLTSSNALGILKVENGWLNINQASLNTQGSITVSSGGLILHGTTASNSFTGNTLTTTSSSALSFALSGGGTLDLKLGTSSNDNDAILGNGGTFSLTGGTINLITTGSSLIYTDTYDILQGFAASGNAITGDTIDINGAALSGYTASISEAGVLSFSAVPEPGTLSLLVGGFALLLVGGFFRGRRVEVSASENLLS